MCKCWTITYSCKHKNPFRLSKCRGTLLTSSQHQTTALCSTHPVLDLSSPSLCGPCAKRVKLETLQTELMTHFQCPGGMWAEETDQGRQAKMEHDRAVWGLEREFPRLRSGNFERPVHTPFVAGQRGVLGNEVRPEDVDDPSCAVVAWDGSRYGWVNGHVSTVIREEVQKTAGQAVDALDGSAKHNEIKFEAKLFNDEITKPTNLETDVHSWNRPLQLSCPGKGGMVHPTRATAST